MAGYQVIARKYRPRTFEEVVGQEAVARTLRNAIEADRVAHAYMFCGPRGVGKTSMARIMAKALNCLAHEAPTGEPCGECSLCVAVAVGEDLDVFEMDAASNRKVDDARNLISNVSFHPARARFKVYIVDEVHMLTTEAFNALLKTLEEPPPHVKFVFATTDPQKVPATILSRCQRFDFRPVPPASIAALLGRICESEGVEAEEDALIAVARASDGGVRDAESLLEQLTTLGRGAVRLEDLHALLGTVSSERMRALFDAVSLGDVAAALEITSHVLDAGTDPGELLRQCMRHAHDLLLVKVQGARAAGVVADPDTRRALEAQAERLSGATLAYSVTLFSEALKNARMLGEGRLFTETALARLAGHRDMRYLDQVVRDLAALEKRLPLAGSAPEPVATSSGGVRERASPHTAASRAVDEPPSSGRTMSSRSSGQDARADAAAHVREAPAPRESASQKSASQPSASRPSASRPSASRPSASRPSASRAGPPDAGVQSRAEVRPTIGDVRASDASWGSGPEGAASDAASVSEPSTAGAAWSAESAAGVATASEVSTAADESATAPADVQSDQVAGASPDRAVAQSGMDASGAGAPVPGPAESAPTGAPTGARTSARIGEPDGQEPARAAVPDLDAGGLRARWGEVREAARLASSRLMAHLQPAQVESLDGDTLVLSFPRSGSFHRSALDGAELRAAFHDALESVLGRRLRVRTTERADGPTDDDGPTEDEPQRDLLRDRLSAAEVDAARNAPLTKLVESELGARIVHLERDT